MSLCVFRPCSRRSWSCPDASPVGIPPNVPQALLLGQRLPHQPIICIPAPWEVWVLSCHPRIKCIVQEQVSQNGTDHTSLRSSASSSDPCSILKFHRCRQPSFDIQQSPFTLHMFADSTQQQCVVDVVEQASDIKL